VNPDLDGRVTSLHYNIDLVIPRKQFFRKQDGQPDSIGRIELARKEQHTKGLVFHSQLQSIVILRDY
jgi:hypothetical protein